MKQLLFLIVLAGFCYSCNIIDDDKQLWQTDTNGCKGRRSKELGEKLIKENHLKGETKEQFTNVFGTPDRLLNYNGRHVMIYLFDCSCSEGQPLAENDKCYAEYTFVNNIMVSQSYICE